MVQLYFILQRIYFNITNLLTGLRGKLHKVICTGCVQVVINIFPVWYYRPQDGLEDKFDKVGLHIKETA